MNRRKFFTALAICAVTPKLALELAKHVEPIKPVFYTHGIVNYIREYGVHVEEIQNPMFEGGIEASKFIDSCLKGLRIPHPPSEDEITFPNYTIRRK